MRLLKLPTLLVSIFSTVLFISCNKINIDVQNHYAGKALIMSGVQEIPVVTTTATGTIDADYSKLTKVLTYKIAWSGLSGNALQAHIHGTAEIGFTAGVLQSFLNFPAATSGTFSGSLLIDGFKITEEDLLAGRYYANIHTALNPKGEIKGQILLLPVQ